MLAFWWSPLLRIAAVCVFASIVGQIFSATAAWAIAALGFLVLVVLQLHYLDRLRLWLAAPETEPVPEGEGVWREVFAQMFKSHRHEQRRRERVAAILDRFVKATQAMPDAFVLLDAQNRIDWCNTMAERHLGIAVPRDREQAISKLVRDPEFARYLDDEAPSESVVIRTMTEPPLSLEIQVVPFGEDEKLMLSRDVTALERAETIRRDFIANVSHELRTPLTVINGFLELLGDGYLDPAAAGRQFGLMREQAARMTRLVEDLLTLSRLEAGDSQPMDDEVDVPGMIASIVDEAKSLSRGRHSIDADIASARLRGSSDELRATFSNLVSNAIRYTPEGGRVAISWRVDEEAGAHFSVADTGIGIAPEHIPRLTERFYRVDRGRSRETGGTGLGLAIVKHVLMRHGGTIYVESELGCGSTFTCSFPRDRIVVPAVESTTRTTSAIH